MSHHDVFANQAKAPWNLDFMLEEMAFTQETVMVRFLIWAGDVRIDGQRGDPGGKLVWDPQMVPG